MARAELANGNLGHMPNRDRYPLGNYEVINSRRAEGSGEKLADAAVELLRQLRPGSRR